MRECGAKWREKRAVTLRGQAVPISTLTLRKKKKNARLDSRKSRGAEIASEGDRELADRLARKQTRRARDVPACRLHFIAFLLTHDLHVRRGGETSERGTHLRRVFGSSRPRCFNRARVAIALRLSNVTARDPRQTR